MNLKAKRNASKFAMFMEKENPHSLFCFSFRIIMNALVYVDIEGKMKVALNEKQKNYVGFLFP